MNDRNVKSGSLKDGYDRESVSTGKILLVTFTGVLIVVFSIIFVNELFIKTRQDLRYEMDLSKQSIELKALLEHETQILNSYGVIDSVKGIYRIPVERAMELEVREKGNQP